MNWWQLDSPKILSDLGTSAEGLTADIARTRLVEGGANELIEKKRKPPLTIFLNQLT